MRDPISRSERRIPEAQHSNRAATPVPRIDTSAAGRQTTVSLDEVGSTLTLREAKKGVPVTAWTPAEPIALACALCQDGVSVLGVRAPVLKSAAARTLASAGLLVDLRARSRVPLDLSRNLVEGDLDAFWAKIIPVCWNAILRAGARDQKARQTMGTLVETLYLEGRCQPLFGTSLASVVQGVGALAQESRLVCVDNSAQDWSEAAGKAIWFCPPSAHFDPFSRRHHPSPAITTPATNKLGCIGWPSPIIATCTAIHPASTTPATTDSHPAHFQRRISAHAASACVPPTTVNSTIPGTR